MIEYKYVTTNEAVNTYLSSREIFKGLFFEMRELSKKKPDTTLNKSKVKILNRVLGDVLSILKEEPEGKYLDLLTDDDLPQNSDAVLVMVQYDIAFRAFKDRYRKYIQGNYYWITDEILEAWREAEEVEDSELDEDNFTSSEKS